MNVIEVTKQENIGKYYKVTQKGKKLGEWRIKESFGRENFDFCNKDNEILSDIYSTSEIVEMEFEEI